MPVLCARYNAYRLGIDDRVDVRQGDLFDALRPGERFDLVVANPPFRPADPHSSVEAMMRDPAHATLRRFFAEIGDHLNPGGRMRIVFSNAGNVGQFHQLVESHGFTATAIARARYASDVVMEVYEVTPVPAAVSPSGADLLRARG
jgi:release factor glutamine methyltransferase